MTDTHNALALANELDTKAQALGCPLDRFSAVLRLQHARIAELEAQLYAVGAGGVGQSIKPQVQADTVQEPVAWRVHPFDCGIGSKGAFALTMRPEQVEMWKQKGLRVEPLYTAPQPARQPLTDSQVKELVKKHPAEDLCRWSYGMGIKDAEAAHGITESQP